MLVSKLSLIESQIYAIIEYMADLPPPGSLTASVYILRGLSKFFPNVHIKEAFEILPQSRLGGLHTVWQNSNSPTIDIVIGQLQT